MNFKCPSCHNHITFSFDKLGDTQVTKPCYICGDIIQVQIQARVMPDPNTCTCKGFYQPRDCPVHGR